MTRTGRMILYPLVATVMVAVPAAAQDFNWRGQLGSGETLEIKGINGDIRAVAARGGEARVRAEKSARRSDPDDVTIEVVEHSGGVTICAVYPTPRDREPNECLPGSEGRMNNRDNDVRVEFIVEVPSNVLFVARTVNGSVDADGLDADVNAYTVNGSVMVATRGLAHAKTVNGSIDVVMGARRWNDNLDFETVNGGITITFDGEVDADVEASTVNGSIATDYPLTVRGRFGPKRLTGTIGRGGPNLAITTVNGDIELRRR